MLSAIPFFGEAQEKPEDYMIPVELEEIYMMGVSPNGRYVVGQDLFYNSYLYDTETQERPTLFYSAFPGDCHCVSNNGIFVGQSARDMKAVVMAGTNDGDALTPALLQRYAISTLNAITPDGSRAVGWLSTSGYPIYRPMYCDLNEAGGVTKVVQLPIPATDMFGSKEAQGYVPHVISNDGKTICGLVTDASGQFSYPIIYRQDDEGKWSYTLPTEVDFNPNNLPLPEFPNNGEPPKQPHPTDFITQEKLAEWKAAEEQLKLTGDQSINPMENLDYYMTDEEYSAYLVAIQDFLKAMDVYLEEIDKYWAQMYVFGRGQNYGGNMFISHDGKTMITLKGGTPYFFDTETGKYTPKQIKGSSGLTPAHYLSDGSFISITSQNSFLPYTSYIATPESDDGYILFTDFLKEKYPEYYPWIEDKFMLSGVIGYEGGEPIYGDYIISGVISVSDDFNTIVGGYPYDAFFSYVFHKESDENAWVKGILENGEDTFKVFSLDGILLLDTADYNKVLSLPKGVYVVNGKKIVI